MSWESVPTLSAATSHRLQDAFDRVAQKQAVSEAVVQVASGDEDWSWSSGFGGLQPDTPFFIASTTKLFVTASLLSLRADGRVDLDDRLVEYVGADTLGELHRFEGVDYTSELKIRHLLAHTSGLPDYFGDKRQDGTTLVEEVLAGNDRSWDLTLVLAEARAIGAVFPPGEGRRAHYSDTNYQLLGRVIETVTGADLEAAFDALIYRPLGLNRTHLFTDGYAGEVFPIRNGAELLSVPRAMASFGPDGGLVSTASELTGFIRGFFEGSLFPIEFLDELYEWKRIFYPLRSGIGVLRFQLPPILTGFQRVELVGYSGLSGGFAFHDPMRGIYAAGTVNQLAKPQLPFQLLVRLMRATG